MGLKKFKKTDEVNTSPVENVEEKSEFTDEQKVENTEVKETQDQAVVEEEKEVNEIETLIQENTKLEDEFNKLPLDEVQKVVENKVNEHRKKYLAYAKKQKLLNSIASGAILAVAVACFILIMIFGTEYSWVLYVCLGVLAVSLAGAFIISKMFKKRLSAAAEEYIDNMFKTQNEYLYANEKFTEKQYLSGQQMDSGLFFNAHFYKGLHSTKSRNLFIAQYNGKTFASADLAASILIKNRTSPMFLGKYYICDNNYEEEDKYILFQLKGGELSRPIDDVDDLEMVEGNSTYVIYSNDPNWRKVLNKKVIDELRKFRIDSTLIDVILSIRKGKTSVGIDYDDKYINIPVDSDFKFNNLRRTEEDLKKVLDIIDTINK